MKAFTVLSRLAQNTIASPILCDALDMDGETRKCTHSFKPTDMPDVIEQAAAVQEKVAKLTKAQGQAR